MFGDLVFLALARTTLLAVEWRMPAKDLYHDTVKRALMKDGWTVTHDPYTLSFGQRNFKR